MTPFANEATILHEQEKTWHRIGAVASERDSVGGSVARPLPSIDG
jgi:hypothetical protein